jgi:hypothetical protein
MSFCPYGIQAETAMKPVVDLLGDKAVFEPHFIVSVSGDTVSSLHGDFEAKEDMRQACIWKNYGQKTFWTYVDYIINKCTKDNLDTCWKDATNDANVDTSKIESCVSNEGLTLMKEEEALSNQNSVSESPTLIINGAPYNGARTFDAYKNAVCSAFIESPPECLIYITTTTVEASLTTTVKTTTTTIKTISEMEILEALIRVEGLKIKFEELKSISELIADYYQNKGDTDKADLWKTVASDLGNLISKLDEIKSEISTHKNNMTVSEMSKIKGMIDDVLTSVSKIISKLG